jgi:hypothetical protein
MRKTAPISLGTMMLFVAVVAVLLVNLKLIAVTHRDDVRAIWENALGRRSSFVPPVPEWSESLTPPRTEDIP